MLSRINVKLGVRNDKVQTQIKHEIPKAVIAEAIVNAVAHCDYSSNGSVQVMIFRNRIEIWNPGLLPYNLSLANLKQAHNSFPANPLIANPLYLAGYIEKLGTGIPDMINLSKKAGLCEPDFKEKDIFKIILWREKQSIGQYSKQSIGQVTGQVTDAIEKVVFVIDKEIKKN